MKWPLFYWGDMLFLFTKSVIALSMLTLSPIWGGQVFSQEETLNKLNSAQACLKRNCKHAFGRKYCICTFHHWGSDGEER